MKVLKSDITKVERLVKHLEKASELSNQITFEKSAIQYESNNLGMRYDTDSALSKAYNLLETITDKYKNK